MDKEATENVKNHKSFLNIAQREEPSKESDKFVYEFIRDF